jgi:hypothetical protein
MKKIELLRNLLLFVTLIICNYTNAIVLPDTQVVVQQIRYYSTESTEIFIVWGIDDWKLQEEELRPEGSFIKDSVLYTPMTYLKDGIFLANLKVKPKTRIDYKFNITKGLLGKETDVWDFNSANQKDYHAIALSDNVVLIPSKIKVRPDAPLTILDFSMPFLSISAALLLMLFIIKEHRFKERKLIPEFTKIIVSGGIVLFIVLSLIRSSVLGFSWDLYMHPFSYIPKLIWAGFYDLVYIGVICVVFFILNLIFGKYSKAKEYLIGFFTFIGLISILSSLLNIHLFGKIGEPLSYYQTYLIEGGNLFPDLSRDIIIRIISVCFACVFSGIFLSYLAEMLIQSINVKHAVVSTIVCTCFIYFTVAPKAVLHYSWEYKELANPVVSFFEDPGLNKNLFSQQNIENPKRNITSNTGSIDYSKVTPE